MKVAVLTNAFPVLSETFVIDHVTSLLDADHEVSIFAFSSDANACTHDVVRERELNGLVTLFDPSVAKSGRQRALYRLRNLLSEGWREPDITLRTLNPRIGGLSTLMLTPYIRSQAFAGQREFDIVHCHFAWSGIVAAKLKAVNALRGKMVVTLHGADVSAAWGIGSQRDRQRMFKSADWFTSNTHALRDQAATLGYPRERCSIWRMGVAAQKFNFHPRVLPEGQPVKILSVSRLVEKKGVEYVLRAIALLKDSKVPIEYHIVGAGPLRTQLEQLAEQLGISQQVIFHGACSAEVVRQHFDQAHIFVLASVTAADGDCEGQGVVLIEAQASGLPIVATHHGGIPEAVLPGVSALLVPERDAMALANSLRYLIGNPELWAHMGRAGREYAENEFAINNCFKSIEAVYERLLSG